MSNRITTIGLIAGLALSAAVLPADARQRRAELMIANDWGGPMPGEGVDGSRAEGFSVAAGFTELGDTGVPALFTAMEQEDWLTAIRLLETLGEEESDILIRDASGMLRPLSTLKVQVLAELPPEGRRTFRTMYAAVSAKLLDDAMAVEDPTQQLELLTALVEDFALCEAAMHAADRLGDVQYERGRFSDAALAYARAADHADGDPDDPRLLSKRLHALARAGDWDGFEALAEYARFRRGDATVRLGGEDLTVNAVIDALAADRPDPGTAPAAPRTTIAFPRGEYPSSQVTLLGERTISQLQQAMANRGVMVNVADLARPQVVAADGRVYAMALGQVTALNPGTGETLWTAGNADDLSQRIVQQPHQITQGYYQSLAVHDDLIITTAHDPGRLDLVRLATLDKATGEVVWNTTTHGESFANHSYIGEPVLRDGLVYAVAQDSRNSNRLALVAFGLRDGEVRWSVELGQPAMDPNWGRPLDIAPRIAVGDRYVMVLTNNGALIAVDPIRREVGWALSYGLLPSGMMRGVAGPTNVPGGVAVRGGVVYSKDTRDDRLVAIRERDAVRLWSAEVDHQATLVHTDARHAYILGDELVAFDLETGERVWWTDHHGSRGRSPSFTDTHALIAGPERMCRIDLTTGKVDGYREDVPAGSTGSPTVLLDGGVAVVGATGLTIYGTESADE